MNGCDRGTALELALHGTDAALFDSAARLRQAAFTFSIRLPKSFWLIIFPLT